MQKKIARKIASITAVSLASGLITVPAGANADLTPNLQIMQKTEIISDEALDQSYQYDYQSDGNDQKFTQVETSWDNAFVAKKLVVGDWKNYDGDVVVSILKDDGMEYQLQTTENAQVELSDYGEISSIKLQPAGEIANSDASMSGMVIDGDIDMSQASDTVELKGTIRESEDGENFTSKVDETVSATVLKTSYKIETPVWKTEQDKLSYGQTAKVTLDGLAGTGTAELSSYECQLIIPKGTEIEQIDLPEFEHATSTLFVDTRLYIIRNGKVNLITHDHTQAYELLQEGKIDSETYYVHDGRLKLTSGIGKIINPRIDTISGKLQEQDLVLMTTDGIHYALRPDAMSEIILNSPPEGTEATNALVNAAKNIVKYPDNMSAMLIYMPSGFL